MLDSNSTAIFSPCRTYRYALTRRWSRAPLAMWLMLNPSRADESINDNTVRRCIDFAKDWGFGGLLVANIFAIRATDPDVMLKHASPVGPENDIHILYLASQASIVVCGWGVHGRHRGRGEAVTDMLCTAGIVPHALRLTKEGQPAHPLYLPKSLLPLPINEFEVEV